MYYIAKKTQKIRYKIVSYLMRKLTPVLYKKIDMKTFLKNKVIQLTKDIVPAEIRPSTMFMKELFDGKLVIGAEIGVNRGKNSENILKKLNIEKLYLIDVWDYYKDIYSVWSNKNYSQVLRKFREDKRVEIIKDFSEKAVNNIEDNSLDFVYIDANHKYNYIYQDIELWLPKVKVGGVIGGHDVCISDVWRAVKDFCDNKNIKFTTEKPDWYFIKHNKGSE